MRRVAALIEEGRDDGFLDVEGAAQYLSTTPKAIYAWSSGAQSQLVRLDRGFHSSSFLTITSAPYILGTVRKRA